MVILERDAGVEVDRTVAVSVWRADFVHDAVVTCADCICVFTIDPWIGYATHLCGTRWSRHSVQSGYASVMGARKEILKVANG